MYKERKGNEISNALHFPSERHRVPPENISLVDVPSGPHIPLPPKISIIPTVGVEHSLLINLIIFPFVTWIHGWKKGTAMLSRTYYHIFPLFIFLLFVILIHLPHSLSRSSFASRSLSHLTHPTLHAVITTFDHSHLSHYKCIKSHKVWGD